MSDFLTSLYCQHCGELLHWKREAWRFTVSHNDAGRIGGITVYAFCICCGYEYSGYVPVEKAPASWESVKTREVEALTIQVGQSQEQLSQFMAQAGQASADLGQQVAGIQAQNEKVIASRLATLKGEILQQIAGGEHRMHKANSTLKRADVSPQNRREASPKFEGELPDRQTDNLPAIEGEASASFGENSTANCGDASNRMKGMPSAHSGPNEERDIPDALPERYTSKRPSEGPSVDYASVVNQFPKIEEAWLQKGVNSAAKHRLTRGPDKSQKYTVASVLKWLR